MNNNPYGNPYVPFPLFRTTHPITTIITEDMAMMQGLGATMEMVDIMTILTNSNLTMVQMVLLMVSMAKMAMPITTNQTRTQLIVVLAWEQLVALAVFYKPV